MNEKDNRKRYKSQKQKVLFITIGLLILTGICHFFFDSKWMIGIWGMVFVIAFLLNQKIIKLSESLTYQATQDTRRERQKAISLLSMVKSSIEQIEESSKLISNKITSKSEVSHQIAKIYEDIASEKELQLKQIDAVKESLDAFNDQLAETLLQTSRTIEMGKEQVKIFADHREQSLSLQEGLQALDNSFGEMIHTVKEGVSQSERAKSISKAIEDLSQQIHSLSSHLSSETTSMKENKEFSEAIERIHQLSQDLQKASEDVIVATKDVFEKTGLIQSKLKDYQKQIEASLHTVGGVVASFDIAMDVTKEWIQLAEKQEVNDDQCIRQLMSTMEHLKEAETTMDDHAFNSKTIASFIVEQDSVTKEAMKEKEMMDEALANLVQLLKEQSSQLS